MATIKWLGGTSTASSTAANWKGGAIPTAGDVALFDNEGLADCAWTLTGGSPVTVDEIVIESTFDHQVILNAQPTIKGLFINGTLNAGSAGAISFKHGSAPNYFGTYKSYAERFILIGDNAAYVGSNTFSLVGSSSPITKFDDGQHPAVRIQSGNFAPDYETPTGTSKKASFTSMTIAGGTFTPESAFSDNDRLKIFDFTVFDATAVNSVNFGLSTVEFTGSSGGVVLPTHNATGYSSTFQAYYRKIILKAATAGHKILLADNTFVSVEEFEIQDGCILKGPTTLTAQGSEVRSIVTPKIRGTWSYSQISPGMYRSPRHASGPIDLINGNVHITGKLNVDGLIDPTGLELDPVSSNPGGVAANTLWLNSGDSNKLYHGSSEVGGGGSGDITAVNTNAPITGGATSGAVTLSLSAATTSAAGSMSGADKTKLDAIEASADVTDTANVTAAGALMDSECASLADVKALNQSVVSGASPTFTTTNMTDASNKRFMTDTQEAKLDALASPFEHVRLALTNNSLGSQSSGTNYYLDLANTSDFSNTGNTTNIVATAAAQDYVVLKAGGMYMVVASVEVFTSANTAAQDFWLQLGNGTSSNAERRNWGTFRIKRAPSPSSADSAVNMQKTVIIDVASTGSDEKVYVIPYVNGADFTVKAYDNNRTNITITRIGASTS